MVLFYGLRSSAACNIDEKDVGPDYLLAIDKGNLQRKIPIDDTLTDIIASARQYKATIEDVGPAPLFVNSLGRRWNPRSLLRSAQTAWKKAGLKAIKIHEIRHTLGTEAGKMFPVGIIQVLMGHKSRKSSENYFHPHEEMATEARKKLVRFLCGLDEKQGTNTHSGDTPEHAETRQVMCPCCGHNFLERFNRSFGQIRLVLLPPSFVARQLQPAGLRLPRASAGGKITRRICPNDRLKRSN